MKTADLVDQDLLNACRAIDAETTDAALRELDRRQSGWFGMPEPELRDHAEKIMIDFLLRKNAQIVNFIIQYIDRRFAEQSFTGEWTMPTGLYITTDVGYAKDWWNKCMKQELLDIAE